MNNENGEWKCKKIIENPQSCCFISQLAACFAVLLSANDDLPLWPVKESADARPMRLDPPETCQQPDSRERMCREIESIFICFHFHCPFNWLRGPLLVERLRKSLITRLFTNGIKSIYT